MKMKDMRGPRVKRVEADNDAPTVVAMKKGENLPLPYWTPPPPAFKHRREKKPKTRGRR